MTRSSFHNASRVLTGMFLTALFMSPPGVEAQNVAAAPERRALFGADGRDPERPQKADVSMSLTMTDDNRNRLASRLQGEMLDSWMLRSGRYPALDGTVRYYKRTKRLTVGADTTSTVQYSSHFGEGMTDHSGGVTLQVPIGRRVDVSASQRILYAPRYRSPDLAIPSADSASPAVGAHSSTTSVRMSHRLTYRSSATVSYDRQSVHFPGAEADLETWGAGARFTRRLTRYAALNLGYAQRYGRYGSAPHQAVRIHDLNLGVDYNRSLSRSLSVTITPGSSIVSTRDGTLYRPSGDVAISRRLGRSWMARMAYRRSSEFIEGFGDPFFVDAASATVAGFVGRTLDLSGSVNYSTSELGSSGETTYDNLSGSAYASLAITHRWAVFAEYLYFNQRMDGAMPMSATSLLNRHSARAGLKWRTTLR